MRKGSDRCVGAVAVWLSGASGALGADGTLGPAVFAWEVSPDEGSTWYRRALEVDQSTRNLLVRARVTWSGAYDLYVGLAFDGVWRGRDRAGDADSVSGLDRGDLELYTEYPVAAIDMGDYIKFDFPSDFEPPGSGFGWYSATVTHATAGLVGGSATVLRFRVNLDGTPGRRDLSEVVRYSSLRPEESILFGRYLPHTVSRPYFPTLTIVDTSVTVIPAPGAATLLFACAAASRRRRR